MIINDTETKIISSLGWADKSSLQVLHLPDRKLEQIKISDANYLSIKKISAEYFIVLHHFLGDRLIISLHSFDNPKDKISEIIINSKNSNFSGSVELWKIAPKYYVEYLKDGFNYGYKLIEIDPYRKNIEISYLDWFDSSYDKGYQSVIDVIEMPDSENLLFSVSRSSSPILYNPLTKMVTNKIKLADRMGNPIFSFRNNYKELWCVDYDVLLKLDIKDWSIINKIRLQDSLNNTMQFIGEFSFTKDEKHCVVARPFSNDIVLLDAATFKIISTFKSSCKPLKVIVLSNYDLVYRDWQSGEFGFGAFGAFGAFKECKKLKWWQV